ncbi:MAG: hypothetical protein HYU63_01035 [Armatimonadetes bacterium]|nr:hypothetical protein [Armatimonadota bacterium]
MKKIFLNFLILFFLFSFTFAQTLIKGMVTNVSQNEIKINLGKEKITEGKVLYVTRLGKLIGKVKVLKVGENFSVAQSVNTENNEKIQIGDVLEEEIPKALNNLNNINNINQPSPSDISDKAPSSTNKSKPAPNFEKILAENTYTYNFKIKGPSQQMEMEEQISQSSFGPTPLGGPILNDASISNPGKVTFSDVLNLTGLYLVYANPQFEQYNTNQWVFYSAAAASIYSKVALANKYNTVSNSTIKITHWDEQLVKESVEYFAFKETNLTNEQKEMLYQSQIKEKGLDNNIVFEINIKNHGPGMIILAPFNWHLYLVSPDGKRYKSERYDTTLDKALSPKQEISGFIYFPKINGWTKEKALKVVLEEIYGNNKEFTWK